MRSKLICSCFPYSSKSGRVKEHAKKLNKMVSESELKPPMPLGSNNASNANIQNNLRDESDLNDQVKRRWMVKSSACDYNELQQMLKDYPKLAEFKDITSGYNALHWAAKFNKPDIIKLIAGTHNVSPNIKTVSVRLSRLFYQTFWQTLRSTVRLLGQMIGSVICKI